MDFNRDKWTSNDEPWDAGDWGDNSNGDSWSDKGFDGAPKVGSRGKLHLSNLPVKAIVIGLIIVVAIALIWCFRGAISAFIYQILEWVVILAIIVIILKLIFHRRRRRW